MATHGRRGARRLLLQALYQFQVGGHEPADIATQFSEQPGYEQIDTDYFRSMLDEVIDNIPELDSRIAAAADRPVAQLDPVEHAVLWIGLTELTRRDDVPHRVAINEAVELAKQFGAQDSYRYVNAILDSVVGERR